MSPSVRSRLSRRPGARRTALAAVVLLVGLSVASPVPGTASPRTERHTGAAENFKTRGEGYIRLAYKSFDPLKGAEPAVRRGLRAVPSAGKLDWWLVQLRYPIRKPARDAVLRLARRSSGYIPEGTFILEMTPETAARVRALGGVRWVGMFHPAYKLRPRLAGSPGVLDVPGRRTYRAFLHRGEDLATVLARFRGIEGVTVDAKHATTRVVPFAATREQLPAVARLHSVRWVSEMPTYVLHNYNARWASDTGERDAFAVTLPGRLNGAGQTAALADTGINYVTDSSGNAQRAFADFAPDGTTKIADFTQIVPGNSQDQMFNRDFHGTRHRKMAAYYDLAGDGYEPSEASNHGTHTGGSIAADYPDRMGRYGTYGGRFDGADGMAPAAHLIVQDVAQGPDGSLGGLPADQYDLYEQVYDGNPTFLPEDADPTHEFSSFHALTVHSYDPLVDARTHNYSIGSLVPIVDLGDGEAADGFVYDHEDFVISSSASNDGPGIFTMPGGPQNAKNALTSCASAGGRQPMVSLDSAAIFSSHGPTGELRLKPDVCTPGQIVVSTKGGTSDADQYLQGTSMSSPVLTGLATLVRQYFADGFGPAPKGGVYTGIAAGERSASRGWNPSAALVRAVMINSADRMQGWYTGDDGERRELDGQWPSSGQGWGRVELANTLSFSDGERKLFVADVWNRSEGALDMGAAEYEVDVTAGEPLEITVTWTDIPSGLGAGTTPLVNNLDLTVTAPDGTTYVGNNFNTQSGIVFNSPPGTPSLAVAESRPGAAPPDVKNNVEAVRIDKPKPGKYTVRIDGGEDLTNRIGTAGGPQGYALVVSGLVGPGAVDRVTPNESTAPVVSDVRAQSLSADLGMVTWRTDEPTTGAVLLTDEAGKTTRYDDVYNPAQFVGLTTPQNENKGEYTGKKAAGTSHEVRLTGLKAGGKYTFRVEATDLAAKPNTTTGAAMPFVSTAAMFQPQAEDIAMLRDRDLTTGAPAQGSDQQWGTSTQLYVGILPSTVSDPPVVGPSGVPRTRLTPAFMFRLPTGVDPSRITGAAVELTAGHDITNHYTDDARFKLSLLDSSVEDTWGPGTNYGTVASAPVDAVAEPETGLRRGAGTTYTFSFACSDLNALRSNLSEDRSSGEERAAFRLESSSQLTDILESAFSFEPGYGRRSRGPEYRPRLVLQIDGADPLPCADTPAPTISDVRIQPAAGAKPTSVVVSWRTDVPSSSIVLFRKAGTKEWTQTGTPFRSAVHLVSVQGLEPFAKYEFAVRSRACNGREATDDNANRGYALFDEPYYAPAIDQVYTEVAPTGGEAVVRWVTDMDADGTVEYGTAPDALTASARDVDDAGDPTEPGRSHEVSLSGLKPCTTYYFRVVSASRIGTKAVGATLAFVVPSATTADVAPVEGFDTGPGDWTVKTASQGLPPTEWAFSGGTMRTAIAGVVPGYGSNVDTRLISPPLKVNGRPLELHFTHTLHSEPDFDFGTVEYSLDDGKTWIPVWAAAGVVATTPTEVAVPIVGVPAGNLRVAFRMASDSNTEVQPGWSVDDVVLREVVPCPGTAVRTATAPTAPKRSPSFHPIPLTGPSPARAARAAADAEAIVTSLSGTDARAVAAGTATCVRVAGRKTTRGGVLPATGTAWAWVPGMLLILSASWLRRRVVTT